ncbi:hypothetical protein [Arthrobacter castelli]|uniref:hypothetical protein n=1 Tax=Arthrobacter castelli TaxID=271431 RepID=UPI0003F706D3|nr:hypothetical protein [Arthrobacter castelli]
MPKFDMDNQTLSQLRQRSSGSNEDLGGLVRQLVDSVAPLEGKFNGSGRARFDEFKQRADYVADDINRALGSIVEGQGGMDVAFQTGDQETADNSQQAASGANFDAAKFMGR